MKNQYKNIVVAYLNDDKKVKTRKYLSIKNVSDEEIVIPPGGYLNLNLTPKEVRKKYPTMPMFSKSVKVTQEEKPKTETERKIEDEIPFS